MLINKSFANAFDVLVNYFFTVCLYISVYKIFFKIYVDKGIVHGYNINMNVHYIVVL